MIYIPRSNHSPGTVKRAKRAARAEYVRLLEHGLPERHSAAGTILAHLLTLCIENGTTFHLSHVGHDHKSLSYVIRLEKTS